MNTQESRQRCVEERLADVLRNAGVMPGRNPDGVNDDPEKADLLIRELQSQNARYQALIVEAQALVPQAIPVWGDRARAWTIAAARAVQ